MNGNTNNILTSAPFLAALACAAALACSTASAGELDRFMNWMNERDHRIWQEQHRANFDNFMNGQLAQLAETQALANQREATARFAAQVNGLLLADMSPAYSRNHLSRANAMIDQSGYDYQTAANMARTEAMRLVQLDGDDNQRAALSHFVSSMALDATPLMSAQTRLEQYVRQLDANSPYPASAWHRTGQFGAWVNQQFPLRR